MKKISAVIISVLLLSFSAASAQAEEPKTMPVEAAAVLDNVGAVIGTFDLGDQVQVKSEQDTYYVLSDGIIVEKRLVRLDSEKAPAERTAYIRNSGETPLYDNPYCEGEALRMLKYNQKLTVQDEFGAMLRVMIEEEVKETEKEHIVNIV